MAYLTEGGADGTRMIDIICSNDGDGSPLAYSCVGFLDIILSLQVWMFLDIVSKEGFGMC